MAASAVREDPGPTLTGAQPLFSPHSHTEKEIQAAARVLGRPATAPDGTVKLSKEERERQRIEEARLPRAARPPPRSLSATLFSSEGNARSRGAPMSSSESTLPVSVSAAVAVCSMTSPDTQRISKSSERRTPHAPSRAAQGEV